MIIKASSIEAGTIQDAIAEINRNDAMMDVAAAYSEQRKIGMGDAIEAIAAHIIYTDEDFTF